MTLRRTTYYTRFQQIKRNQCGSRELVVVVIWRQSSYRHQFCSLSKQAVPYTTSNDISDANYCPPRLGLAVPLSRCGSIFNGCKNHSTSTYSTTILLWHHPSTVAANWQLQNSQRMSGTVLLPRRRGQGRSLNHISCSSRFRIGCMVFWNCATKRVCSSTTDTLENC